jgi:cytochrome c peroxidase
LTLGRTFRALAAFGSLAFLTLLPAAPPDFKWPKPEWVPVPLVPEDNPMTDAKVRLGRYLFYDHRLSRDGSMSCATCHHQARGFTDGQPVHAGVDGSLGIRNAMALTNVAFLSSFTWANPKVTTLEKQVMIPLFSDHPLEMGMQGREKQLTEELGRDDSYRQMFTEAFPAQKGEISLDTIAKAIACFERTLLSFNSPYDRFLRGDKDALSASARRGGSLFFGERLECYHCHGGLNFTDNNIQQGQAFPEYGFHNTGLYNEDGNGAYKKWDHGLRDVTDRADDEGRFRTPTLRNVALSAPYMHDGSIATLEDVIRKHYALMGRAGSTPDGPSPLRDQYVIGFNLADSEVEDVVAFLNSLTDEDFIRNPSFSDPRAKKSK